MLKTNNKTKTSFSIFPILKSSSHHERVLLKHELYVQSSPAQGSIFYVDFCLFRYLVVTHNKQDLCANCQAHFAERICKMWTGCANCGLDAQFAVKIHKLFVSSSFEKNNIYATPVGHGVSFLL